MPGLTRTTTPISNQILFDYTLPPAALLSYLRLQALASAQGGRQVGPLDFAGELMPLLGLHKTQVRQHLRLLRIAKLITWVNDAAGRCVITLHGATPAAVAYLSAAPSAAVEQSAAILSVTPVTAAQPVDSALAQDCQPGVSSIPGGVLLEDTPVPAGQVDPPAVVGPAKESDDTDLLIFRETGIAECVGGVFTDSNLLIESQDQQTQIANPESANMAAASPVQAEDALWLPPGTCPGFVAVETRQDLEPPADPWTLELEKLLADPAFAQALSWLARAGVWTDRAVGIARQICANEKRGHAYLPTRADILGWIAYCFAYQEENKIKKPTQTLAGNLANTRRCPEELRPPRICTRCNFAEGFCKCHAEPDYVYPAKYIEFAFVADFIAEIQTFWGICLECGGFLCRCLQTDEDLPDDDEENAEEDET